MSMSFADKLDTLSCLYTAALIVAEIERAVRAERDRIA